MAIRGNRGKKSKKLARTAALGTFTPSPMVYMIQNLQLVNYRLKMSSRATHAYYNLYLMRDAVGFIFRLEEKLQGNFNV